MLGWAIISPSARQIAATDLLVSMVGEQVVLRSAHRAQELVLFDFLCRLYESRAARAPSGPQYELASITSPPLRVERAW
jgi:hypothetical protein